MDEYIKRRNRKKSVYGYADKPIIISLGKQMGQKEKVDTKTDRQTKI